MEHLWLVGHEWVTDSMNEHLAAVVLSLAVIVFCESTAACAVTYLLLQFYFLRKYLGGTQHSLTKLP
jgi:hypothetical protein